MKINFRDRVTDVAHVTTSWTPTLLGPSVFSLNRSSLVTAYNPLDADADPFRPPAVSTIVGCLHCGEEYDSYRIEWRVETDSNGRPHGFWCCPIENCDGRGFGFDIFPVDPEYRNENGDKMWMDDDEQDENCLGESLPW